MGLRQLFTNTRNNVRQVMDQRHDRKVASTKRSLTLLKLQTQEASEREKLAQIKARKPSPFGMKGDSPLMRMSDRLR